MRRCRISPATCRKRNTTGGDVELTACPQAKVKGVASGHQRYLRKAGVQVMDALFVVNRRYHPNAKQGGSRHGT